MGLDTSHDCYHGGYIGFNVWREMVGNAAGWWWDRTPAPGAPYGMWWLADGSIEVDDDDPILFLLGHSDAEDDIPAEMCGPLADCLEQVEPLIADAEGNRDPDEWRQVTRRFITGLRLAVSRGEAVRFG